MSTVRVQQLEVLFAAFPDHSLEATNMLHRHLCLHQNRTQSCCLCCGAQRKSTFSSLQQRQGVISQCVDSEADHRLRFVHAPPQSGG